MKCARWLFVRSLEDLALYRGTCCEQMHLYQFRREAECQERGLLHDMTHHRGRLVQQPDGCFCWTEVGWAAGYLLPPG